MESITFGTRRRFFYKLTRLLVVYFPWDFFLFFVILINKSVPVSCKSIIKKPNKLSPKRNKLHIPTTNLLVFSEILKRNPIKNGRILTETRRKSNLTSAKFGNNSRQLLSVRIGR